MSEVDLKDLERRMTGAVENFQRELAGLRTGRASVSLLEPIMVEAYGNQMPLNQVATISVPESRMLTVQVWDHSQAKTVEKAIRDSGLGLNPQAEGAFLRVPLPELNEERRTEITKIAGKYAEQSRVAVRNVRRDGMDTLKKLEKDHEISEDEHRRQSDEIQKMTDDMVQRIDDALHTKEQEIMQV